MRVFEAPVLAAAILLTPGLALAQAPKEARLGAAAATLKEPFGLVNAVRELSDGRVVVAAPLDGKVVVVDPAFRAVRQLGREGQGPGEYRQPDAAWPFPGDSTLIVDLGNARLSILAADGSFGRSMPMTIGRFNPGAGRPPAFVIPRGVDASGRVYFQGSGMGQDSTEILRIDARGKVDSVGRVKLPSTDRQSSGGANQREVRMRPIPFAGTDGWAVAPNGSVGVARVGDYHVDWIGAAATKSGRPVAVDKVRIGSKEKEEWALQQQLGGGIGVAVEANNGDVRVSFRRGAGGQEPDLSGLNFPAEKPYFDATGVAADGSGRLWVSRSVPAGQSRLYDVFGPDGNLIGSVRFPEGRRLVGFGKSSLYAVQIDDDGLNTLERYALPL
ncbi:MAG: hypothetical protein R2909_05370 [Gemmatimonadales bacterium]